MTAPADTKPAARLALVTGASRGIGRSIAVALARHGTRLILVARTVGGLEETDDLVRAAGGEATLVPLDLLEFDGIDRLGAQIFERWGKLDALVANAAMLGVMSPLNHIEPSVWERTFALNVTATWRLIRSCDPLIRQSDAGRMVVLGSAAAEHHRPYWGLYAASKAAVHSLTLTYAAECANTPIKVNVIDPGPMRTNMRAQAMPGEDPETLPHPDELGAMASDLLSPRSTVHGEIVRFKEWTARRTVPPA